MQLLLIIIHDPIEDIRSCVEWVLLSTMATSACTSVCTATQRMIFTQRFGFCVRVGWLGEE